MSRIDPTWFTDDTAISDAIHVCRTCGMTALQWGPHYDQSGKLHRRLFEGGRRRMRLHVCRGSPREQRTKCEGFGDIEIPIEYYERT